MKEKNVNADYIFITVDQSFGYIKGGGIYSRAQEIIYQI